MSQLLTRILTSSAGRNTSRDPANNKWTFDLQNPQKIKAIQINQIIIPTSGAVFYKLYISNVNVLDVEGSIRFATFIIPNTNITTGFCYINGRDFNLRTECDLITNQIKFELRDEADNLTSIADWYIDISILG
jgi:hypothetical protein